MDVSDVLPEGTVASNAATASTEKATPPNISKEEVATPSNSKEEASPPRSNESQEAPPSKTPKMEDSKEATPLVSAPPTLGSNPQSKRALKKLRKREEWLETRGERRIIERDKRKKKLEKLRESGVHVESLAKSRKRLKDQTRAGSNCKVGVIIDMSFDDYMNQKDLGKCCKQLQHCYW